MPDSEILLECTDDDRRTFEKIYSFWFGENLSTWSKTYPLNTKLWFKVQENVDREIKENFEQYLLETSMVNSSLYKRWQTDDRGILALILLFDQFSRNIYRGTSKMFEFDYLTLPLVFNLIDDPDHVKRYSLPERLFIYMPLIHSEILENTRRGAELLEQLATEVSQRDVRRRYVTNARSARVHQELIERFGRFPHRNQLLGRESTEDEKEYLKTATNGFVRSVQSAESSQSVSQLCKTPTDQESSPRSRLKILVLHSLHQNANSLKRGGKKVFHELKDIATFHFANAPLPYNPAGDVKDQLMAAFGDGNIPNMGYQRQWWNASEDSRIYHHLDVSLHYLDQLFKSEGPFDGVFGFSQGATLTAILCASQPFGNISFRFAILASGFASRAECHEEIMKPGAIKGIPSLHIYGLNDVLVTHDRTLKLAAAFENPIIVSHSGGHFTPNTWPTKVIKQFLLDHQRDPLNQFTTKNEKIEMTSLNQTLLSFKEKIQATITSHAKYLSTLMAYDQKQNKSPVTPVGLASQLELTQIEQYIQQINNYALDDIMLLVWCKRSIFHNSEPTIIDNNKHEIASPFFHYWIMLFISKPDEILSNHLKFIPKYGSWTDLKTLYSYASKLITSDADTSQLLSRLKDEIIRLFAEQLTVDYQVVLKQPDESANDEEDENKTQKHEWISTCAKESPRISHNRNNMNTVMAKAIAIYLRPINVGFTQNEKQLKAAKVYAYLLYKRMISSICHVLEKASPIFVSETMKSRNRKDRAFRLTKEQREALLNEPPSSYITNPEPEPVVPCAIEDLQPLLEYLTLNKPGPVDEQQPVVFTRGTIMSGGRLDLCKQVVGPKGIQPLLDAMKNSEVVNRLLLGNNIVGLPGAHAISQYIRFNQDSHIDTWYIAGNHFDSECILLICNALATDTKVKALWLKRNPILASGAKSIGSLLTTNNCLQTLDLLNTGLLDEGCQIIFEALKVNQTLKHLYLDTNGLTVKSGQTIRAHFESNTNQLESLYLSCNSLGDAGTCEIAAGLKYDRCLQRLGLASNCIGFDGARELVDALIDHPSLLHLNLGFMKATVLLGGLDNVIGDQGAAEIARLIRQNPRIRSIDLTFNGISQRGLLQLKDALETNQTLTTLKYLQFGQVHNEITKEQINGMIEGNKIRWGTDFLTKSNNKNDILPPKADCLRKGQELNDDVNYPSHVMEIISYYRTH